MTKKEEYKKFETYGKPNLFQRMYNEVKYRFVKNPHADTLLKKCGLDSYIPKLNKWRFGTACFISLVFIALPFVTLLAIPTMLWGIK